MFLSPNTTRYTQYTGSSIFAPTFSSFQLRFQSFANRVRWISACDHPRLEEIFPHEMAVLPVTFSPNRTLFSTYGVQFATILTFPSSNPGIFQVLSCIDIVFPTLQGDLMFFGCLLASAQTSTPLECHFGVSSRLLIIAQSQLGPVEALVQAIAKSTRLHKVSYR